MASIVTAVTGGAGGGNQGAAGINYQAGGAQVTSPFTNQDAINNYAQESNAYQQQNAFLGAVQAQNGLQNQSSVYNQLQGVANGTGPNPAQAQLAQATGANTANQAALMAGQRGAGQNVGLMGRQIAQQGAANQQNAAGQAASMQAQQSLGALSGLGQMATNQANQQANATGTLVNQAQAQTGQVLNSIQGVNQANVNLANGQNAANAGIANTVAGGQLGFMSSMAPSAGSVMQMFSGGGRVGYDDGGDVSSDDVGSTPVQQPTPSVDPSTVQDLGQSSFITPPPIAPVSGSDAINGKGAYSSGSSGSGGGGGGGGIGGLIALLADGGPPSDAPSTQDATSGVTKLNATTKGPSSKVGKYLENPQAAQANMTPFQQAQAGGAALGNSVSSGVGAAAKGIYGLFSSSPTSQADMPSQDETYAAMQKYGNNLATGLPAQEDTYNAMKQYGNDLESQKSVSDDLQGAPEESNAPAMAKGGKVPALLSPGERYLSPEKVAKVAAGADPIKEGKKVPGKPKVGGAKNSYKNDNVKATLDEGGIVLPRSVTQSKHPHWEAHKFVSAIMAKHGGRLP